MKTDKSVTVVEAGRKGGQTTALRYSHEQLSAWGKRGGWPKGKRRKPQARAAK